MTKKLSYAELEQRAKKSEKKACQRKREREALGEFREFKEKIISASPVGMSIYNASGQCIEANDSIAELIGATRSQVLEQNYNNIASWKKSGMLNKAKSAVRENSKKRHELKVRSTFGKDVSLDCHLVPFLSEGQKHLLLMINDISGRVQIEMVKLILTTLTMAGAFPTGPQATMELAIAIAIQGTTGIPSPGFQQSGTLENTRSLPAGPQVPIELMMRRILSIMMGVVKR